MNEAESLEWLDLLMRLEESGNDTEDVFEMEEFYNRMAQKYGKPFRESKGAK